MQKLCIFLVYIVFVVFVPIVAHASSTTILTQTLNPGSVSMDIVDALYESVVSPVVAMGTKTAGSGCQSVSETLGTPTQQIYGINSESGVSWNINLVASAVTDLWTSSTGTIDYNDPAGDGCTGGQMTVNPSVATLTKGQCASCGTGGLTLGTAASFSQGVTDSITILSGEIGPGDTGDWKLTGVAISQKIPANKPAGNYVIKMVLTITAI